MRAPWLSCPTSLVENFTALEVLLEARSASLVAHVARWRAFAHTTIWAEIVDMIATFASSDEAVLNPTRPWHCSSLVAEFRKIAEGGGGGCKRGVAVALEDTFRHERREVAGRKVGHREEGCALDTGAQRCV